MGKIIRSQFFQLRKSTLINAVFIGLAVLAAAMVFITAETRTLSDLTAGCHYYAFFGSTLVVWAMMFSAVSAGFICGHDFTDKTINYELMSGRSRAEAYFGRAAVALIVGTVGGMILYILPLIADSIVYGWGTKMPVGLAAARVLLSVLVLMRFICEMVCLSFVVKNPYAAVAAGYFVSILLGQAASGLPYALASSNMFMLAGFREYGVYGLEDGIHYVYDASLTSGQIFGTAAASLIIGAAALYIGYVFFKKDDLN